MSAAATCPKCGSNETSLSYHAQGCSKDACSCAECSYNAYAREHREHLHVVCTSCRYDWIKPTLETPL